MELRYNVWLQVERVLTTEGDDHDLPDEQKWTDSDYGPVLMAHEIPFEDMRSYVGGVHWSLTRERDHIGLVEEEIKAWEPESLEDLGYE